MARHDTITARIDLYRATERGSNGGPLHIAIEDHNLDDKDLRMCLGWAREQDDEEAAAIASALLELSMVDRLDTTDPLGAYHHLGTEDMFDDDGGVTYDLLPRTPDEDDPLAPPPPKGWRHRRVAHQTIERIPSNPTTPFGSVYVGINSRPSLWIEGVDLSPSPQGAACIPSDVLVGIRYVIARWAPKVRALDLEVALQLAAMWRPAADVPPDRTKVEVEVDGVRYVGLAAPTRSEADGWYLDTGDGGTGYAIKGESVRWRPFVDAQPFIPAARMMLDTLSAGPMAEDVETVARQLAFAASVGAM